MKTFNLIHGAEGVINPAELQVSILKSFGTTGILNFVFAFGTRNDGVISIVSAYFMMSSLLFMPLSALWINKSKTI